MFKKSHLRVVVAGTRTRGRGPLWQYVFSRTIAAEEKRNRKMLRDIRQATSQESRVSVGGHHLLFGGSLGSFALRV
ncbi:hypothetical protein EVAR_20219_1 [Eumeta japonica]|uniref:Uncharacterized protein n=1 Tax=Eumeta variegata TaxID=151549 RepID=A0A4C1WAP3_EUMVA|nr:hypothetical protein EVAR_20219_1 [Eumeta japonica]